MADKITYSGNNVTIWGDRCEDIDEFNKLIAKVRNALDKKNAAYDKTDRGNRYIFSEKTK